ncbi:MAG: hypothetical protein OER90_07135 [Gemmatimonadota bacterium]|nr:hypothetical protein [Gemmatimonadota bacterium]
MTARSTIYHWITFWLLLLLLAVFGPFLLWIGEPTKSLNVLIIDKTVPTMSYREHQGLVWVLNHLKYRDSTVGGTFNAGRDYVGFFPNQDGPLRMMPVAPTGRDLDLLYLADTYGVYSQDFTEAPSSERAELIFGGLNAPELEALEPVFSSAATVIAEFNTLASPTTAPVRERLEELFGVTWTGWTGRRFASLKRDSDVPGWLVRNWERQTARDWTFSAPGFAIVHDDGRIVLLLEGQDVARNGLRVDFPESLVDEVGVSDETPYGYWFDVVEPRRDVLVVAQYQLAVTDSGSRVLQTAGLPERFPAIVHRKIGQSRRYYFAGDFADLRRVPWVFRVRGVSWLRRWGVRGELQFFWNVYLPLMRWILMLQTTR